MPHAEHDRVAEEVRSWYRTSFPEMGYRVERRRFGFYGRNDSSPGTGRIVVEVLTLRDVPEFLEDARQHFDAHQQATAIDIWLDDEGLDRTVGPGLVAAGCFRQSATIYLAHVGSRPTVPERPDVTIETVSADTLTDFATVRLKGFANSENQPSEEQIAREVAIRRAELNGSGRCLLARVGGEPAGILAYYGGRDRLIFLLATRVPMRKRGVARQILLRTIADAYDSGGRSVIINTNPEDTPIQWYRREGFTDPVYWHRSYVFEPERPSNSP
jgi:GNAT superfamily N-acetyltransferase